MVCVSAVLTSASLVVAMNCRSVSANQGTTDLNATYDVVLVKTVTATRQMARVFATLTTTWQTARYIVPLMSRALVTERAMQQANALATKGSMVMIVAIINEFLDGFWH